MRLSSLSGQMATSVVPSPGQNLLGIEVTLGHLLTAAVERREPMLQLEPIEEDAQRHHDATSSYTAHGRCSTSSVGAHNAACWAGTVTQPGSPELTWRVAASGSPS